MSDYFILIDTGTPNRFEDIIAAVEEHFGKNSRPKVSILIHGHFDYVCSIIELVNH